MAGKAKGNYLQLLYKPVHPVIALVVILICLVGVGSILMLALQSNQKSAPQQYQTQRTLTPTPILSPSPVTHTTITIPPADWLSNSYQYYDSNLDATMNVPNGWSIANDPSAAGEAMPGQIPQPIGKWCFADFYLDPLPTPTV